MGTASAKGWAWISATLTIFWEIARFGQKGPPDAQIGSAQQQGIRYPWLKKPIRQGPLPYRDSWFRQGSFARGAFMGRLSPHNGPRIKAKWNGYQVLLPPVACSFCRLQRYIIAFCLIYLQEIFMPWLLLADFLPVWCFLECKSSTNPLSIQDATLIILPDCQNFQYDQSWVMTNYRTVSHQLVHFVEGMNTDHRFLRKARMKKLEVLLDRSIVGMYCLRKKHIYEATFWDSYLICRWRHTLGCICLLMTLLVSVHEVRGMPFGDEWMLCCVIAGFSFWHGGETLY